MIVVAKATTISIIWLSICIPPPFAQSMSYRNWITSDVEVKKHFGNTTSHEPLLTTRPMVEKVIQDALRTLVGDHCEVVQTVPLPGLSSITFVIPNAY